MVGVGDGLDDGEAEAVPVGVPDALAAFPLERLKESVDLARRDSRAGVADGDGGLSFSRDGGDLDSPAGGVVAERIVDEVCDEEFDEFGVTGCGVSTVT